MRNAGPSGTLAPRQGPSLGTADVNGAFPALIRRPAPRHDL